MSEPYIPPEKHEKLEELRKKIFEEIDNIPDQEHVGDTWLPTDINAPYESIFERYKEKLTEIMQL